MRRMLRGAIFAGFASTLLLAAPAGATSGSVEMLNECLAAANQASDRTHARSLCYWKHNERMASYGR